MKIVVSKDEIQEKLSNIQSIVEKRNTMPILSHFLLDAGKKASYIIATDLETALKEPLQIRVEKEGKICIPARKMFEIVREIEGDLVCESVDEQWLKIKTGASNFRLACLSPKEFPVWPGMEDMEEISMKAGELLEVIERTVYAAGESDTRYTLNGLLFHLHPNELLTVVGTDGHRLALSQKKTQGVVKEEKKFIIPRKSALELRKLLESSEEPVRIALSKNHILLTLGEIQFLSRLIEGTYPNYEQVIPAGNEKKIVLQKETFAKAIRRVAIMSKERSNAIRIDIGDNLLAISSNNPDLGDARDELAVTYSGESLSLGFNARYILDILDVAATEAITMEFQAPLSPVLIREEGRDDSKNVIMPMRI